MSITRTRENRARRLHGVLVAPVALLLVLGASSPARAAAPQCSASSVRIDVPAGGTVALPTASCSDADGDPIAIEITRPPAAGALDPATPEARSGPRHYTAFTGAAGTTDTVGFRAVAAGEASNEVSVDVVVGAANRVPVCDDVTVTVAAGGSARVPFTRCVDADGDHFDVVIEQEPASGRFDYVAQTYTPAAGFAGEDVMTFRAVDVWLGRSALGTVRLIVGDDTGAGGGGTAPPGSLPPGSSGGGAGTVLPPDAAQGGSRAFTLRAPSRQRLATARRRGVRFRAEAAEPGRLAVKVLVGRKLARRLKLGREASGAVKIGRSKLRLRQGTSSRRIKLSRTARAGLKRVKAPRVRLRASFRTADGEVHVQTRRVRLTRGRR